MTVMVSERDYCRTKFVYSLPEQWWEASGVAGNGLITQNSSRAAQRVPDNARLVTPNSNKGTDKQLQQLHVFTKTITFPTRQQLSQVINHIALYLDSTKIRQMIKIIFRHTDQHANHSCRREHGDTNSWDKHQSTICCCCFVSNNNHIFAIHWFSIK